MDHLHSPITDFLRGPLLSTPQGWVVIGFSAIYLIFGFLILWIGLPQIFSLKTDVLATICFLWPGILFLYFVRVSSPSFFPSFLEAAWLCFYAIAPIGFWLYNNWHSIFS